jgi:hypothetical protein
MRRIWPIEIAVSSEALVRFRGDGERAGREPPARGRISECWS